MNAKKEVLFISTKHCSHRASFQSDPIAARLALLDEKRRPTIGAQDSIGWRVGNTWRALLESRCYLSCFDSPPLLSCVFSLVSSFFLLSLNSVCVCVQLLGSLYKITVNLTTHSEFVLAHRNVLNYFFFSFYLYNYSLITCFL